MQPLLGAVRALASALEQFDDAAAQALGVGRSDLRALNLLEDGALPAGVLAARLGLSSGATTALVDRLVVAGFAMRQVEPEDGRKVLIGLQPAVWQAFAPGVRPVRRSGRGRRGGGAAGGGGGRAAAR